PSKIPSSAVSRSASSKTTAGDFPPSSKVILLISSAAFFIIELPVLVDPVKATLSTSLLVTNAFPATLPDPGTTLTTQSGNLASLNNFAAYSNESGVSDAGLITLLQPAACV